MRLYARPPWRGPSHAKSACGSAVVRRWGWHLLAMTIAREACGPRRMPALVERSGADRSTPFPLIPPSCTRVDGRVAEHLVEVCVHPALRKTPQGGASRHPGSSQTPRFAVSRTQTGYAALQGSLLPRQETGEPRIAGQSAGRKPIMWDDALRHPELRAFQVFGRACCDAGGGGHADVFSSRLNRRPTTSMDRGC